MKGTLRHLLALFLLLGGTASAGNIRDAIYDDRTQQEIEDNLGRKDLAIVVVFRDEAEYLKEWIEYHLLLGVQHFYCYNNLSQDNYLEVLKPYVDKGIVDLFECPQESKGNADWIQLQKNIILDTCRLAAKDYRWVAAIDIDEFLVPTEGDSLVSLLKNYENEKVGGVCFRWMVFGTSHVAKIPSDRLMIETLLMNGGAKGWTGSVDMPNALVYKTVVRPDRIVGMPMPPHYYKYKHGYKEVRLPLDVGQLNHYWCRDEDYLYRIKIARRLKWGSSIEAVLALVEGTNQDTPYSLPILRFVRPLRERMGMDP